MPGSVLSNLAPALVQTFLTILIGYMFGRWKLLPPEGVRAMGMFVTTLALPTLLLRNMMLLDFGHVVWSFVEAIFISKCILFGFTCLVCMLRAGPRNPAGWSDAGCFAIFVTQSNDFALGLPILQALFAGSPATAGFPQLLYLLAPINLAILNPIAFFLMEMGREKPVHPLIVAAEANAAAVKAAEAEAAADAAAAAGEKAHGTAGEPISEDSLTGPGDQVIGQIKPMHSAPMPAAHPHRLQGRKAATATAAGSYRAPSSAGNRGAGAATGFANTYSPHSSVPHFSQPPTVDSILDDSSSEGTSSDESDSDDLLQHPGRHSSSPALNVGSFTTRRRNPAHAHSQQPYPMSMAPDVQGFSFNNLLPIVKPLPKSPAHGSARDLLPLSPSAAEMATAAAVEAAVLSPVSPSTGRTLLRILLKVVTNPVVFCSFLGIGLNLALGGSVPGLVDGFLAAMGDTFSALALFILGVNMNGKLALFRDRRQLSVPLILIVAKSLVLPIVIRLMMGALGMSGADPLTLCGFLIGTFPTAPSSHFFAVDCGARSVEYIAPAMVLGTFVAAPIMFVSAQMVTVALSADQINTIISDSSRIAAGFGFLAAVWCFVTFAYNKRWAPRGPHGANAVRAKLLMTLTVFQAAYTLSVQYCVMDLDEGAGATWRMRAVLASQFGVYLWCAFMALNEAVRRWHGQKAERALFKFYNLTGLALIVIVIACVELLGSHPTPLADLPFCACWNRFGQVQWWCTMVLMGSCLVCVVFGVLNLRADASLDAAASADTQPHINFDRASASMLSAHLLESDAEQDERGRAASPPAGARRSPPPARASTAPSAASSRASSLAQPSSLPAMINGASYRSASDMPPPHPAKLWDDSSSGGGGGGGLGGSSSPPLTAQPPPSAAGSNGHDGLSGGNNVEEVQMALDTNIDVSQASVASGCSARGGVGGRLGVRAAGSGSASEAENFWLFAMRIWLLFMAASIFLSMALYVWNADKAGTRVEVQLLDAVIFSCASIATLALFAATPSMISPLRPVKRCIRRKIRQCRPED